MTGGKRTGRRDEQERLKKRKPSDKEHSPQEPVRLLRAVKKDYGVKNQIVSTLMKLVLPG